MPLQRKKNTEMRASAKFGNNADQKTGMGRLGNPASCRTNFYSRAKWNILVLCMKQHWPYGQLFDSICPLTNEPLVTQLMAAGYT